MIVVSVYRDQLYAVQEQMNATNRQVATAGTRAIKKTLRWIGSHGKRQIAKRNQLPLKSLRGRVRMSQPTAASQVGHVWFGISDMPAINLGAKQTATGVQTRGRFFKSAFIANVYGTLNVFKRKDKARFPVIVQKVPLESAEEILAAIADNAPERLQTIFAQEINYVVNVKGE